MAADMSQWDSQVIERFKVLLNVGEISGSSGGEGVVGDDDEAKLKRAAIARNRNPGQARAAHEALTALAFSGYQDWCSYDEDEWTRNCLGQVLGDDQNSVLVPALRNGGLAELEDALEKMAGMYAAVWQQAAEEEAAEAVRAGATVTAAGLVPAENVESWEYSRTPGTRYYIFHDGQYLYCDDQNAPLASWATAEDRDEEAAGRATEWETGSGVFCTSYDNPAHAGNVTHVFGLSKYGPWNLTQAQATSKLAESRQSQASGVAGEDSPAEPYYNTGHFTKYHNGTHYFGEASDATIWYPAYQDLLTAIAQRGAVRQQGTQHAGAQGSQMPASCGNAKACFSISARTAWLTTASGVIKVNALGGRAGHPTPTGNHFKVIFKDAHHRSTKYKDKRTGQSAPMPFYVNFAPEVGFHAGSLSEESHGCIHLSQADAQTFFNHLQVGDPVTVIH
jgi:hypothetical protein